MCSDWSWKAAGEGATEYVQLSPLLEIVVESAGLGFETAAMAWHPKIEIKKKDDKSGTQSSSEPNSPASGSGKSRGGERKKKVTSTKLSDAELHGDHYEVIGLSDKEHEATEDEISKAYKKACLETHPDKTGGDDTLFKAVQVAGDVLQNAIKKRAYDSSLPFDDAIPPVKVTAEKFYTSFTPVFERNSKWSTAGRTKVPSLGGPKTPMEEVDDFYKFWFSFSSWRDFSYTAAEHDLEQAECREERRWMERENQRAVDKNKKVEDKRMMSLVDRAQNNDPRIKAREAERVAAKEAIREAKRKAEEDRKAAEKAEVERLKKEEETKKIQRKENLQKEKKGRQTLRKLARAMPQGDGEGVGTDCLNMTEYDWLLGKLDLESLTSLIKTLQASPSDAESIETIYDLIEETEMAHKEDRKGKPIINKDDVIARKKKEVKKQMEKEWTENELIDLQKACTKYPSGTVERWNKLSEFMLSTKTPEQCLKKVKQLESEYRMPQQAATNASKSLRQKKPDLPSSTAKVESNAEEQSWYNENQERKFKDPVNGVEEQPAEPAAKTEEPEPAKDELSDIWSTSQQKTFETVLRELKAYKEKDKWDKIAAAVEGKNKKQCVARYKFLCSKQKK